MNIIAKSFTFDAAHRLDMLPAEHKCSRLHGHTYTVTLVLTGDLDPNGFVVDYGDLGEFKDWIDNELDHRYLNDIIDVPTAELLAHFLFHTIIKAGKSNIWGDWTGMLHTVVVQETPKTMAAYSPDIPIVWTA